MHCDFREHMTKALGTMAGNISLILNFPSQFSQGHTWLNVNPELFVSQYILNVSYIQLHLTSSSNSDSSQ